jgi:hypothetical protein
VTAGSRNFSTLMVAVALFGLAGAVVVAMVPHLFTGSGTPGFPVFLLAGVAAIVLTAGLFAFIGGLGMGFGKTALVLAAGYNALIAVVKLGLAPAALYEANREQSFDTMAGDPNNLVFYIGVGTAVLFLYVVVFRVMYGLFKRRFRRRTVARNSASREFETRVAAAPPGPADGRARRWGIFVAVVAVVAVLASFFWIVPVFFVAIPTLSYLSYVFATFGAAMAVALILAALLAYWTFDEVEKQAVRLGDATVLANFFWLGLALILIYHAMWAVFLLTMVSIWPFRTYTPK